MKFHTINMCVCVCRQRELVYIIEEKFFSTIHSIQCLALMKHLSSRKMFRQKKATATTTTMKLKTKTKNSVQLWCSCFLSCFSLLSFMFWWLQNYSKSINFIFRWFILNKTPFKMEKNTSTLHNHFVVFFSKYLEWLAH